MKKMMLILVLSSLFSFSQNSETITKSSMNAYVYKDPSLVSLTECVLKKNTKVIVEAYSGYEFWQVKTKKCSGYAGTIVLIVNEEMKKMKKEYINETKKKAEIKRTQREFEENKLKQEKKIKEERKKFKSDSIKEVSNQRKKDLVKQKKIKDSLYNVDLRTNCHYDKNEIDEFDNVRIIRTKYYWVSNNLHIELYRKGNRKYVFFDFIGDLGCASSYSHNRSYVKVKLENNDIVTFYHSWDVDCHSFSLKGNLNNSDITRLKKSPIKSIRLQGTDYYDDVEKLEYKEFFIDKLKCIK